MIVNLDYHDPVYIKKDTPVAHIHEEDVSCEYLEVNEVVESMQGINWVSKQTQNCKVKFGLFSCTDHRAPESGTEGSQCIKGD